MGDERRKEDLGDMAQNAAAGYAVVVLGVVCFLIALVVIAAIVRLVVGVGVGAGAGAATVAAV